jgi:capsular polysaccharide biosynthesis protein
MNNFDQPMEDEIDLRAIVLTIWKARKAILIVTFAAAVIAFALSFWVLPRKYQATAYIFVGQPVVEFIQSQTESGLQVSTTLPDIKAVVKLLTAPALLESVLKDPAVAAAFGNEEISVTDFTGMVNASDVGKDQLSLQVTDTDPQRAAQLANTWAEKAINVVNDTYGLGALARTFDAQVMQAQKDYEQAQTALEEAYSTSQVPALSAQLDNSSADLANVLGNISNASRVLDDLQFFEQSLTGLPDEAPLSLGDGLALTTLRQRSLTVGNASYTIQIDSASFAGFTVSKALEATSQMRTGLQDQLTRLQSDQSRLEQEIPQLNRDLSNANAQLTQFSTKRNQFLVLYTSMTQQQKQVATLLGVNMSVANLSVEAVPPDKKFSPKVVMNTALAGMLGLVLSVFWVLAAEWWKKTEKVQEG